MSQHIHLSHANAFADAVLVMDYGPNPWIVLRKSAGLPRAASGCLLTNMLTRLRGQRLQACQPLLEVFLSTFLIEPARPLAAHQVGVRVRGCWGVQGFEHKVGPSAAAAVPSQTACVC